MNFTTQASLDPSEGSGTSPFVEAVAPAAIYPPSSVASISFRLSP
ncbi:hypothetical protein [Methanoregula sp. PtaU1.Bin006]|nr:hypothetical protein [Methanoregula sp. PtaU1.Bin006]